MAKRTKKYNPTAQLMKRTPDIIANTGIYELPGDKCEFISFNNKHYDPKELMKVYTKPRQMWTIALLVFRINKRGKKCLSVDHAQPPFKCVADLMTASVKQKHMDLVARTDEAEIICTGWLAIPRDEFISSVKLVDLFDRIGVWDRFGHNSDYVVK